MNYTILLTCALICASSHPLSCSDKDRSQELKLKTIIDAQRVNGRLTRYNNKKEQALAQFADEQRAKRERKKMQQAEQRQQEQPTQNKNEEFQGIKFVLLDDMLLTFCDGTCMQRRILANL